MDSKGLILFATILAMAYSYRINEDFYDSPDFQRRHLSRDELEKRASHGCKFTQGVCLNGVYSYGCHNYKKKCNGDGCKTTVSYLKHYSVAKIHFNNVIDGHLYSSP